MAKNDVILIDSLLQQLNTTSPETELGEHFEKFVLEQVLKNFDLSNEELDFGWTDGSLDGGIDGFYVLVNGRLLARLSQPDSALGTTPRRSERQMLAVA